VPEKSTQSFGKETLDPGISGQAGASLSHTGRYPMDRESFEKFWPFYVGEHLNPLNRRLHFVGSALALLLILSAVVGREPMLLLAAPIAGYFFAWLGHFAVEGNRPATFKAPWLSLRGDGRMFRLMLMGQMQAEVERLFPRDEKRA
jgi:hypothetical protein